MDEFMKPTNSLLIGSFDAIKMDAVDAPLINIDALSNIGMSESYFLSAIHFLKPQTKSYTESKIALYKAISESAEGDTTAILESFSDYYVQADAIIKKSLEFLKGKIDAFIEFMEHYIEENESIKDHKKDLTDNIKYYQDDNLEGYNYTIDDNIPDVSAVDAFNASLFDSLFRSQITDLSAESISQAVTAIDIEQDLRVFRAKLLGQDGVMTDAEFARMLYLIFRDNTSNMIELDIDAKKVRDIASRWFGFSEYKTALNRQYKSIDSSYDRILKKISKICKDNNGLTVQAFTDLMPGDIKVNSINGKDVDTSGMMMSADMMVQLDIYCKAKLDIIEKYTNLVIIALSAKMDAIKSMYEQDRKVLFSAIEVLDHPDLYYDPINGAKSDRTSTVIKDEDLPKEEPKEKDPLEENMRRNAENIKSLMEGMESLRKKIYKKEDAE